MAELLTCIGAAALWVLPLVLLTACLGRRRRGSFLRPRAVLAAWPLFYAFQVVLPKALDLAGLLGPLPVLIAHVGLGAALGARLWFGGRSGTPEPEPALPEEDRWRDRAVLWTGLGAAAFIVIAVACVAFITPVRVYDVQTYHMPMVAEYFQNRSLAPWPTQCPRQIFRVNGMELQILNLVFLSRSAACAEFPNVPALVVSLAAALALGRRALRREDLAWAGVLAVLAAPMVVLGAGSAKNGVVLMGTILCTLYWVVRMLEEPEVDLYLKAGLAGLSMALACATKPVGPQVCAAAAVVLGWSAVRGRLSLRAVSVAVGAALLSIGILVGDLYWRNFVRSGVPFGVTPREIGLYVGFGPSVWWAQIRYYLYEFCFKRLLLPPVSYGRSHFGYLFPAMVVLAPAAVVFELRKGRRSGSAALRTVMLFTGLLFVLLTFFKRPYVADCRWMVWLVPCLAVVGLSFLRDVRPEVGPVLVTLCATLALCSTVVVYRDSRLGLLLRRSGVYFITHRRLPRMVDAWPDHPMMEGYRALERAARPGDRVLYVGGGNTWMYPCWGRRFSRKVRGVAGAEDAVRQVASGRYDFLVVESKAAPPLKAAVSGARRAAGYTVLARGTRRSVFRKVP